MSRSIDISYRIDGSDLKVSIQNPYDLFGCQQPSKQFWSLDLWGKIGLTRLSMLGTSDPIYFFGWDDMELLYSEIKLIHDNVKSIDFAPLPAAQWLANLTYCHSLLVISAPKESIPMLDIG